MNRESIWLCRITEEKC